MTVFLVIHANCQVELTSAGLTGKTDRLNFKDSQILGYELTLQTVFNNHFLLNAAYSKLDQAFFGGVFFDSPELGAIPDKLCPFGGNIGYRFTPHENFAIDLQQAYFYEFNE